MSQFLGMWIALAAGISLSSMAISSIEKGAFLDTESKVDKKTRIQKFWSKN